MQALLPLAHAGDIPIYYWDNQEKLVSDSQCKIEKVRNHPFRLTSYFGNENKSAENLRAYNGNRLSLLNNDSLVG